MATPTPIADELGRGTPKEPDFHEKVKKVAREYGVPDALVRGYVEKTVFPGGRSGQQQWDGGYGSNARGALGTIEKQLNFFKQTGMTPREATEAKYKELLSMKGRESEVASALGIPNYEATQKRREYLASAEERRANIFRTVSDPHQRMIALQKFDEELARFRAEDRRGGKKRKTRKSKKSARKTRRRRV
jgi:hypothetical protein